MFNQVFPTCISAKKPQNTLCTKGLFAQRKNIPSGGSLETLDTQLAITSWESLVLKTSWHGRDLDSELAVHLCAGADRPPTLLQPHMQPAPPLLLSSACALVFICAGASSALPRRCLPSPESSRTALTPACPGGPLGAREEGSTWPDGAEQMQRARQLAAERGRHTPDPPRQTPARGSSKTCLGIHAEKHRSGRYHHLPQAAGMPTRCAQLKKWSKRSRLAPSWGSETLGAGQGSTRCMSSAVILAPWRVGPRTRRARSIHCLALRRKAGWPLPSRAAASGARAEVGNRCCHKARMCSEVPEAALRVKGPPTQAWDA